MKITKTIAKKVLSVVDKGLSSGLGNNVPGEMCVEAAVCYALGLPHSDNPPCVGAAVRAFQIKLNDCEWSSKQARTAGMRKIAVAQLGSESIYQKEFSNRLAIKTCNQLLPKLFRLLAKCRTGQASALRKNADMCEKVVTIKEAETAARNARGAAYAAADAASAAYAADAASAAYAADAAAYAAYAAYAAAYAAYAAADAAARDEFLSFSADLALEVLVELESPGTKFLDLCSI